MPNYDQPVFQDFQLGKPKPFNPQTSHPARPKASRACVAFHADQIMALVELEERGFTFSQFSEVVGHQVTHYGDLHPDDAETVLQAFAGCNWRDALW